MERTGNNLTMNYVKWQTLEKEIAAHHTLRRLCQKKKEPEEEPENKNKNKRGKVEERNKQNEKKKKKETFFCV